MKPFIGICCTHIQERNSSAIQEGYYHGIEAAGGIPVLIPLAKNKETLYEIYQKIDGLLLSGGVDVDPKYFNEVPHIHMGEISPERDENELYLAKQALEGDMPILGICRGMQILAIANGGTLYQDLPSQASNVMQHQQRAPKWYATHEVSIEKNSRLYRIYQKEILRTNSFHHQAVKEPGKDFHITAKTVDGVIEAIEQPHKSFVLGVQWHPELMWKKNPEALQLLKAFVAACS